MIDLPDLPLEDIDLNNIKTNDEIKDESNGSLVFGIIGSGQCGSRLAESFFSLGYKKTICCNTAKHDLSSINIPDGHKIHFDIGLDGAAKDMKIGEQAADKYYQNIYDMFSKIFSKVDRIIICAGLGGGSGAGSLFVLLDAAKEYLKYIGVKDPSSKIGMMLTLPTIGEQSSRRVNENVSMALTDVLSFAEHKLIAHVVLIDNSKIENMLPSLTVDKFWPTVNSTVVGLFHVFNLLSKQHSNYTSFDTKEYDHALSAGGCMIFGVSKILETDLLDQQLLSMSFKMNIEKTLLASNFDLRTASVAVGAAIGSKKHFSTINGLMKNVNYAFDTLAKMTGEATVHRGVYEHDKDKFIVYTLISGLASPKNIAKVLEDTATETKEKKSHRIYG